MPYWKQDTRERTQTHILLADLNAAELELSLDVGCPSCLRPWNYGGACQRARFAVVHT
jgi:hypothetical protein